ncbi:hypothetical protein V8C86DRAFT_2465919 [Haematococcus lacustris]|nr:hypothetical protein QJQ45_019478 [Haematococcus lacustris]
MELLQRVEFCIAGKVQGVSFRKYTQRQALSLGVAGWVKNELDGTVCGVLEGPAEQVEQMQQWLKTTGSPNCRIAQATFHTVDITRMSYIDFIIKK